jgi:hypothetical protein
MDLCISYSFPLSPIPEILEWSNVIAHFLATSGGAEAPISERAK